MGLGTRPLRVGILGSASIARDFVDAVRCSTKLKVTAIASRTLEQAQEFAHDNGIEKVCGTYARLLDDPNIDAVYNPLPNTLHAEWSIRAAKAGKHILCEKPLGASVADVTAMIEAARTGGVYLLEAFPYRSQPINDKLKSLIYGNEIGAIKLIRADFGFPISDATNIRLNASLKGGSLWDAGCYPVSLATMVARARPSRVHASATWGPSGVDLTVAATIEFGSGLIAQISSSFETAVHRHAMIAGTDGVVMTEYENHPQGTVARLEIKRGAGWDARYLPVEAPARNGFLAEAEAFADCVNGGLEFWNGVSNAESIDIAHTLEAIEESARRGRSIDIPSCETVRT